MTAQTSGNVLHSGDKNKNMNRKKEPKVYLSTDKSSSLRLPVHLTPRCAFGATCDLLGSTSLPGLGSCLVSFKLRSFLSPFGDVVRNIGEDMVMAWRVRRVKD